MVKDIAVRIGRTPAQVVLRWQFQKGCVSIPKTSHPTRMRQNLDIFGFVLDDSDIAAIDGLGAERRRICETAFSPEWDA